MFTHASRSINGRAGKVPKAQLVEIADSATLIPEDQPERLAEELKKFLADNGTPLAA